MDHSKNVIDYGEKTRCCDAHNGTIMFVLTELLIFVQTFYNEIFIKCFEMVEKY
jgi:hypothetical protein